MALDNPHIDYFSLDIEGAELVMLKTLQWDKIWTGIVLVIVLTFASIFIVKADWGKQVKETLFKV